MAKTLPASSIKIVEENLMSSNTTTNQKTTTDNLIKSINDIDVNLVVDHARHVRFNVLVCIIIFFLHCFSRIKIIFH